MSDQQSDLSHRVPSVLPTQQGQFWGGQWHHNPSAKLLKSINPSTGEELAQVQIATLDDVNQAVASAKQAFPAWARTPPLERARRLREAAARIRSQTLELALLDAADCGNPVKIMQLDAEVAAAQLEYFAGLVLELKGETIPTANGSLNYTRREPLGVVARIFPFNHPFMFAAGKIAAPLAAGNTVVIKPPEQAPLSTLRLMELLADVFPPGVLNCVVGERDVGAALVAHPDVSGVALIGSVPAGQAVMRSAADGLKRTVLELGGKNAMIVFPDANLDLAVEGAVRGMNFTWCGQSCGSTSRLFVPREMRDDFVDKLVTLLRERHVPGIATHMDTTMGALINQQQYERCLSYIESARQEGATLVTGGKRPDDSRLKNGYFIEPTVFTDVKPTMRIAREEIFGPVLSVFDWTNEAEMLDMVNGVEFGLTASIWTENIHTGHRLAEQIEAGYIWINDSSTHFLGAPFGGYKMSGLGREESKDELFEFTQIKNVNVAIRRP